MKIEESIYYLVHRSASRRVEPKELGAQAGSRNMSVRQFWIYCDLGIAKTTFSDLLGLMGLSISLHSQLRFIITKGYMTGWARGKQVESGAFHAQTSSALPPLRDHTAHTPFSSHGKYSNTCAMFLLRDSHYRVGAQGFSQLVRRCPLLYHIPTFQTPKRKTGIHHKP